MSGKSGAKQLYIVDEASGYPEEIFTSIFCNLAGGGKALLTGNPTRLSGTFHGAFHANRARWKTLHVSSLNTPNFHGGNIPGLAGPKWHAWALGEWGGPGNPIYDVRVLGRFPAQGENAVVPLEYVEAGKARWPSASDDGELEIGVDVAREGDDESILAALRGTKLLELQDVKIDRSAAAMPPGPQVGEAIVRMARRLRRPEDRYRTRIKIDAIGVGTAVLDYLVLSYSDEFEIVAVNTACSADTWLIVAPATEGAPAKTAHDEYRNLRAQLAFGVARWLREGGAIPDDGKLEAELVAPTFSFRERGKLAVEDKRDVKKRLKRSPDRADALALAVYDPPRAETDRWVPDTDDANAYRLGGGRGF
jgi:phage terminase large subunit